MADKLAEASPSTASTPSMGMEERTGSNWWDSWITAAKTKSAEVYTMVKKDLDEIGSAVKCEATHVFSTTSNVIGKTLKLDEPASTANTMKNSISSFIGQVSTVLNPEPDDEDDTEVILSSGDTTMLSTYKKELEALQRVDATFIVPAYSPEFDAWKTCLELNDESVITATSALRRLETNPVLRAQYDKLVPDAVTHDEFWERYLFRVALLQDRLAAASRKQPLAAPTQDPVLAHLPLQTQEPIQESPKKVLSGLDNEPYERPDLDNAVVWDEEDFANDLELTEEQQTLLLEEYEKEISSKKLTKETSWLDNIQDKTTNTDKNKLTQTDRSNKQKKTADKKSIDKKKESIDKKKESTYKKESIDKKKETVDKNVNNKKDNTKKGKSPKKTKADLCGNNLVEDHFGDSPVKDDASSNSDESWEKEFEIEDAQKA